MTNCVTASFTFGDCRIEAINKRNDERRVSSCRRAGELKAKSCEQVSFSPPSSLSSLPLSLANFFFSIVTQPAFINFLRLVALFYRATIFRHHASQLPFNFVLSILFRRSWKLSCLVPRRLIGKFQWFIEAALERIKILGSWTKNLLQANISLNSRRFLTRSFDRFEQFFF